LVAALPRCADIKLDEFALHENQRELYANASPCILWGGQLSIISTHRGVDTVFNEMIRSVKEQNDPLGLSHHRITIHDAVQQGLVERVNAASRRNESRGAFLQRLRKQCLDEEQWLREYFCTPMEENTAFLEWSLITPCEHPNCLKSFDYLSEPTGFDSYSCTPTFPSLYVGVDVARKQHLCVIDVGERIGDVIWDRMQIEQQNKTFAEIEHDLWRLLSLPSVNRCCIDATGLGMQLAERAKERFGSKAEPITFTPTVKEELAFELRRAFEDRKLRIDPDPALRADLRGVRKQITSSGNIRFVAESEDGHCDRFWAKALRQHAARRLSGIGGGLAI
jgi:phage FluMu gp28-like protein